MIRRIVLAFALCAFALAQLPKPISTPSASSSGTVSSVGLTLPTEITVTNSPVTGSGTLTGAWANANANTVFSGPSTGAATTPAFRALAAADIPANSRIGSFGCTFDGAGSALVLNDTCYTRVPYACTVTGWSVIGCAGFNAGTGLCDTAGTFTADVLRVATGTALPTSSIAGSSLPALAANYALKSTTLTKWETAIAADDLIGITLTAVSGVKWAQVLVECQK